MRGPPFWTGCCAGFMGRRMAKFSSAVGTILAAGERKAPHRHPMVTRKSVARATRKPRRSAQKRHKSTPKGNEKLHRGAPATRNVPPAGHNGRCDRERATVSTPQNEPISRLLVELTR